MADLAQPTSQSKTQDDLPSEVTVALVQLCSEETEPTADRIERALSLATQAARSADLVVLPELWLAGAFDVQASGRLAQAIQGPLVQQFQELAARHQTWIHMGSIAEREAGHTYNTSVLIDAQGRVAETYRKRHLFGFEGGELDVMTAGEELVVANTPIGPAGLATCYDLRFPEQFRSLVDLGATAFLMASGWPTERIEHWRVLLKARAIENQAWMIACNGVGTQCGTKLGGRSAVIDPLGHVIAEAGTEEEVLFAQVNSSVATAWRAEFPALEDRR
ncbi:MAG: carbon-nitrogen family hydrolase [Actinomycetes bacterium]